MLWLCCRLAALALIRPLAWEPPHAVGVALKRQKKKKKKKKGWSDGELWARRPMLPFCPPLFTVPRGGARPPGLEGWSSRDGRSATLAQRDWGCCDKAQAPVPGLCGPRRLGYCFEVNSVENGHVAGGPPPGGILGPGHTSLCCGSSSNLSSLHVADQ